jgi:hypothetical protein
MSEFIGYKFSITVNGVDLSSHVTDMKNTRSQEIKEWLSANASGTSAQRHRLPGVQDMKLDVTYKDDLAGSGAGSVNATHEALMGNTGYTVTWCYNGLVAAPSATNPVFTMTAIHSDLSLGGAVNEVMEKQVSYMLASGSVSVALA